MSVRLRQFVVYVTIAALLGLPGSALSSEGSDYGFDDQVEAGQMTADALVVRPLGIVSTVLGFSLFVVSVPFSALGGNTGEAWNALVKKPAKFTFARPLGEFD